MKRYWYTNGSFIETDNGEIMASSEVLPELDRLEKRISELEAKIIEIRESAGQTTESLDAGFRREIDYCKGNDMNNCKFCGNTFCGSGVLCSTCQEIHDSHLLIHTNELRARIAELEAASAKKNNYRWWESKNEYPFFCMECMEQCEKDICETCGAEGRLLINENEDTENLEKWLDMKVWQDASEPPEHIWGGGLFSEKKLCAKKHGEETEYWIDFHVKNKNAWSSEKPMDGWRDLPPMPGKESR